MGRMSRFKCWLGFHDWQSMPGNGPRRRWCLLCKRQQRRVLVNYGYDGGLIAQWQQEE